MKTHLKNESPLKKSIIAVLVSITLIVGIFAIWAYSPAKPMPEALFALTAFALDSAQEIIAPHPEIKNWAVGGHSLGGAMAASFVLSHPGKIDGLVLWSSYIGYFS